MGEVVYTGHRNTLEVRKEGGRGSGSDRTTVQGPISKGKRELKKWLSAWEHDLLLQRTPFGFWFLTPLCTTVTPPQAIRRLQPTEVSKVPALTPTGHIHRIKLFFFFKDRVSLCSPGCPGTLCRPSCPQTHRDPPASAFWVLGLKVCAPCPAKIKF